MILPYIISIYVALGSRAVQAMTYIIDPGCGISLNPIIAESIKMASVAIDKLGKHDEVLLDALNLIFKTTDSGFLISIVPSNSLQAAIINFTDGFNIIKGLSPTIDHAQADVRIYCDNDAATSTPGDTSKRWQLEPDIKLSKRDKKKGVKVNSEKDFKDQIYWDPINQLYRPVGSLGVQGLDDEGTLSVLAQTYTVIPGAQIESTQNPNRATITFSPLGLSEKFKVLGDISVETDLTKNNLEVIDMEDLLSLTFFHELCHLPQTFNCPGSKSHEPHGWDEILPLSTKDAKDSADAYAFLGLLAILSERNARVSTDAAKAQEGIIQWIQTPTPPTKKRGNAVIFSS